ncbi:hypothetical protein AAMO2058_000833400 [Amorphochlora amoebiformis]
MIVVISPHPVVTSKVVMVMMSLEDKYKKNLIHLIPHIAGDTIEEIRMLVDAFKEILDESSKHLVAILGALSDLALPLKFQHLAFDLAKHSLGAVDVNDYPSVVRSLIMVIDKGCISMKKSLEVIKDIRAHSTTINPQNYVLLLQVLTEGMRHDSPVLRVYLKALSNADEIMVLDWLMVSKLLSMHRVKWVAQKKLEHLMHHGRLKLSIAKSILENPSFRDALNDTFFLGPIMAFCELLVYSIWDSESGSGMGFRMGYRIGIGLGSRSVILRWAVYFIPGIFECVEMCRRPLIKLLLACCSRSGSRGSGLASWPFDRLVDQSHNGQPLNQHGHQIAQCLLRPYSLYASASTSTADYATTRNTTAGRAVRRSKYQTRRGGKREVRSSNISSAPKRDRARAPAPEDRSPRVLDRKLLNIQPNKDHEKVLSNLHVWQRLSRRQVVGRVILLIAQRSLPEVCPFGHFLKEILLHIESLDLEVAGYIAGALARICTVKREMIDSMLILVQKLICGTTPKERHIAVIVIHQLFVNQVFAPKETKTIDVDPTKETVTNAGTNSAITSTVLSWVLRVLPRIVKELHNGPAAHGSVGWFFVGNSILDLLLVNCDAFSGKVALEIWKYHLTPAINRLKLLCWAGGGHPISLQVPKNTNKTNSRTPSIAFGVKAFTLNEKSRRGCSLSHWYSFATLRCVLISQLLRCQVRYSERLLDSQERISNEFGPGTWISPLRARSRRAKSKEQPDFDVYPSTYIRHMGFDIDPSDVDFVTATSAANGKEDDLDLSKIPDLENALDTALSLFFAYTLSLSSLDLIRTPKPSDAQRIIHTLRLYRTMRSLTNKIQNHINQQPTHSHEAFTHPLRSLESMMEMSSQRSPSTPLLLWILTQPDLSLGEKSDHKSSDKSLGEDEVILLRLDVLIEIKSRLQDSVASFSREHPHLIFEFIKALSTDNKEILNRAQSLRAQPSQPAEHAFRDGKSHKPPVKTSSSRKRKKSSAPTSSTASSATPLCTSKRARLGVGIGESETASGNVNRNRGSQRRRRRKKVFFQDDFGGFGGFDGESDLDGLGDPEAECEWKPTGQINNRELGDPDDDHQLQAQTQSQVQPKSRQRKASNPTPTNKLAHKEHIMILVSQQETWQQLLLVLSVHLHLQNLIITACQQSDPNSVSNLVALLSVNRNLEIQTTPPPTTSPTPEITNVSEVSKVLAWYRSLVNKADDSILALESFNICALLHRLMGSLHLLGAMAFGALHEPYPVTNDLAMRIGMTPWAQRVDQMPTDSILRCPRHIANDHSLYRSLFRSTSLKLNTLLGTGAGAALDGPATRNRLRVARENGIGGRRKYERDLCVKRLLWHMVGLTAVRKIPDLFHNIVGSLEGMVTFPDVNNLSGKKSSKSAKSAKSSKPSKSSRCKVKPRLHLKVLHAHPRLRGLTDLNMGLYYRTLLWSIMLALLNVDHRSGQGYMDSKIARIESLLRLLSRLCKLVIVQDHRSNNQESDAKEGAKKNSKVLDKDAKAQGKDHRNKPHHMLHPALAPSLRPILQGLASCFGVISAVVDSTIQGVTDPSVRWSKNRLRGSKKASSQMLSRVFRECVEIASAVRDVHNMYKWTKATRTKKKNLKKRAAPAVVLRLESFVQDISKLAAVHHIDLDKLASLNPEECQESRRRKSDGHDCGGHVREAKEADEDPEYVQYGSETESESSESNVDADGEDYQITYEARIVSKTRS